MCDAHIMRRDANTGKRRRGFFYSLNARAQGAATASAALPLRLPSSAMFGVTLSLFHLGSPFVCGHYNGSATLVYALESLSSMPRTGALFENHCSMSVSAALAPRH
jgi:hypothetical protein